MVGHKMNRHHCALCGDSFPSKSAWNQHMANHPEPEAPQHLCETCNWSFGDSLALETHKITNGHGAPQFQCGNCPEKFFTEAAYNKHRKFPSPCSDAFKKKSPTKPQSKSSNLVPALMETSSRGPSGYVDLDAPAQQSGILPYEDERSSTPSDVDGIYCHTCKGSFGSQAQYDRHLLWCVTRATTASAGPSRALRPQTEVISSEKVSPPAKATISGNRSLQETQSLAEASRPSQPATAMLSALHQASPGSSQAATQLQHPNGTMLSQLHGAPSVVAPRREATSPVNKRPLPPLSSTPSGAASASGTFVCNLQGCQKTCKSEAGLKIHQADAHGVGGEGLDLHGKDSWMLSSQIRSQLKNHGLLRSGAPAPPVYSRPSHPAARSVGAVPAQPPQGVRRSPRKAARGAGLATMGRMAPPTGPKATTLALPAVSTPLLAGNAQSIGGPADLEQANNICGKIARLRIQSDISIQHDGKMICSGIAWTRIGVAKQADVVGMFDKLAHLPRKLQATEYLPTPKTFKDEYQADYPSDDFQHSPNRLPAKPGLGVIAISCSKVMLDNGCQEAVKIAVIDVLSCRILMNYLVCTDTKASVKDWRARVTGLSSFGDIEAARQAGYKVLKGWQMARDALWRFIDRETIIVGYNLRSDLDALRMIHGRAVDVAKSVEKAAAGPLSKQQLSLDSLCRDYPQVHLTTHATYGRDCLQNAFAIREFGLWMLKHGDELAKKAKQKSLEYQRVNPTRG